MEEVEGEGETLGEGEEEEVPVRVPLGRALALEVGGNVEVRLGKGVRVGGWLARGDRVLDTEPVEVVEGKWSRVAVTVRVLVNEGAALFVEVGVLVSVRVEEADGLVVAVLVALREEVAVFELVALRVELMEGITPPTTAKDRGVKPPGWRSREGARIREGSSTPPSLASPRKFPTPPTREAKRINSSN